MKIFIYSPLFYPSIGGLETVTLILAHEFVNQGHEVIVASLTPANSEELSTFQVVRRPNFAQLLKLIRWCNLLFQPNISLKTIWMLPLSSKPWVVSHNNWYCRSNGDLSWQDYLKHFLTRFAINISVSQAVADHINSPSTIIPNPYRHDLFKFYPEIPRTKELVFLGRLVSDKGVDILLDALAILKSRGLTPQLTIIGEGPEKAKLQLQTLTLGIVDQVDFVGSKVEQDLVQLLNTHQIMVVPSRWKEPFGVVALEGIACGCVIVASEGGGLKEAVGHCGVTFPNGNLQALVDILISFLSYPPRLQSYRIHAKAHLAKHSPREVIKSYLVVMESAIT